MRRKTWPERSWPFLNLGLMLSNSRIPEELNDAAVNNFGCVWGVSVARVKHKSLGTVTCSPEGMLAMHSPPEYTMTRSRMAGPKNQLTKRIHMAVKVRNLNILSLVRIPDGPVKKVEKKDRDVQPQARLMKMVLSGLDLVAKVCVLERG